MKQHDLEKIAHYACFAFTMNKRHFFAHLMKKLGYKRHIDSVNELVELTSNIALL